LNRLSIRRCRRQRAGLTILEFLACTIAVLGGAYLGALYLGVDVQRLTFAALSQVNLLDKMPAELRPADPAEKIMTRDQLMMALHEELGGLRNQIRALHAGVAAAQGSDTGGMEGSGTLELPPTKEKTFAYWTRLNEIAMGEAALQRDAEVAFNAHNAAKVFAIKGRVSRFSAKAVEAVPTQEVDQLVIRFGRQLTLWYDRGGELYEKAVRIWETPIGQQARAQLNDEWKRSDEQHRAEARLLAEKAAAVRGSMSRIYGVEFPEFNQPVQPAANAESDGTSGRTAAIGSDRND
jgi:hypothetical protein